MLWLNVSDESERQVDPKQNAYMPTTSMLRRMSFAYALSSRPMSHLNTAMLADVVRHSCWSCGSACQPKARSIISANPGTCTA